MTSLANAPLASALVQCAAAMTGAQVERVAAALEGGAPTLAVVGCVAGPEQRHVVRELLAVAASTGQQVSTVAALLRGCKLGHAAAHDAQRVEVVWSGPGSTAVPVRATAQVLVNLVSAAEHELLLATYSARRYQPLVDALRAAIDRGVSVTIIVETLGGAGSALQGEEPAAAFFDIPDVEIWCWPPERRTEPGSKMHAKLAVADRRTLLVTSANLTQAGVDKNIEAGLLVRGGTAPVRAVDHVRELQARGELTRFL